MRGMSLIELIIILAILGIMSLLGISAYLRSREAQTLLSEGQNILATIRRAQAHTRAGVEDNTWGVQLETNRYIFFRGASYGTATFTQIYDLPSSLTIANIVLAGGRQDIVFERITGKTVSAGTFVVQTSGNPPVTFPVTLDVAGQVYATATIPSANTRILDARHYAFHFFGGIKNAVNMTFTFGDPASPELVYPLPVQDYLDPGKTKFEWMDSILVGNEYETFRIHSTLLNDGETVLSIDRDCWYNQKKLTIAIDGADVAMYESDCKTVSGGPGIMASEE
ncbi:MAG: Uncharacterized protein G01um101466_28 [Parcubacteria group bacterium Gr01-1014_66]|nr:MAG: Uncharacterized protein G01um101466_28 [Parcubacteria group bacterium Gr01-1014_66]